MACIPIFPERVEDSNDNEENARYFGTGYQAYTCDMTGDTENVVASGQGLSMGRAIEPRRTDADPLSDIALSREQMRKAFGTAGIKAVAKSIPGIGKLVELAESANAEVREEKLTVLLNSFAARFDTLEDATQTIKALLRQRAGLILMQKIIQIVDAGSADEEWITLLANVLIAITDADLARQFEELSYVLAQIAKLSPQALLVLSHHPKWANVRISGTTTTSGQTMCGNWNTQAADHLAALLALPDSPTRTRIAHAFADLMSAGLVQLDSGRVIQTSIGAEVFRQIHRL